MSAEPVPRAVVELRCAEGAVVATVSVAGGAPALFVVDVVARVELAARAIGWTARLRDPAPDLVETRDLCGLPPCPDPRGERG